MKIKKKVTGKDALNKVIQGGKAQVEQKSKKRGKPKSKIKKERKIFNLSKEVIEAIEKNCQGNMSYFVEEAVKFYLDKNKH